MATLYLSVIEYNKFSGESSAVFCLTENNPDDLLGEELEQDGIFIESVFGSSVPWKRAKVKIAMNSLASKLRSAGINVITQNLARIDFS